MKHPRIETHRTGDDFAVSIDLELPGTPDEIWEMLTTEEGITRWFTPQAHVQPGVGGMWAVTWDNTYRWIDQITDWEPGQRLRVVAHPEREAVTIDGAEVGGRPAPFPYALEFTLTGKGGSTQLRLVQSGFLAADNWEDEVDSFLHGWRHQFYSLAHALARHAHDLRSFVRSNLEQVGENADIWGRIVAPDSVIRPDKITDGTPTEIVIAVEGHGEQRGEVLYYEQDRQLIANIPAWQNSLFAFGLWKNGPNPWLVSDMNLYGSGDTEAEKFAEDLEGAYKQALEEE